MPLLKSLMARLFLCTQSKLSIQRIDEKLKRELEALESGDASIEIIDEKGNIQLRFQKVVKISYKYLQSEQLTNSL